MLPEAPEASCLSAMIVFTLAASLVLRLIHIFYSFVLVSWSIRHRIRHRPRALKAARGKIPKKLGLVLVYDEKFPNEKKLKEAMIRCVERTAAYCRVVGVSELIVYDRRGILVDPSVAPCLHLHANNDTNIYNNDAQTLDSKYYPLTPPLSDDPDSQTSQTGLSGADTIFGTSLSLGSSSARSRRSGRFRSAHRSRHFRKASFSQDNGLIFHFVSRDSGKPAIANVATMLRRSESFLKAADQTRKVSFPLEINDLQEMVEGDEGVPPPDLMIVHHVTPGKFLRTPLELHGFPPWQVRLSEIYHNEFHAFRWPILWPSRKHRQGRCNLLLEQDFCGALDVYAGAEMRLGK